MGRITVFTGNDSNSLAVLKALERRKLPYSEISLADHPSRAPDLKALSGKVSVPRVFFNTKHIGGVDETLRELSRWDRSENYETPLDRYNAEIKPRHDPGNPKLAVPQEDEEENVEEKLAAPKFVAPTSIRLLDGTSTSYHDITEKLKNTLSITDMRQHKKVFSGSHAAKTFELSLGITKGQALTFGTLLLSQGVIQQVSTQTAAAFDDSDSAIYRLQCFSEPSVLNSYAIWTREAPTDPVEYLQRLDALLHKIEMDGAAEDGLLDLSQAFQHADFALFEEMISALQVTDFLQIPMKEKLPFALNLYNLMIRYAFIKVGVPISDADRLHFMNGIKFKIGGHVFSLNDWVNGVLRGNSKSSSGLKAPFSRNDARRSFVLPRFDHRIHYAINVGSHSRAGLPFRRYTSQNIDKELHIAGCVFWEDEANLEVIMRGTGEIRIPKVLAWYRSDFGNDMRRTIERFADHMLISQIRDIQEVLSSAKVTFLDCNWARNARTFSRYDKEAIVAAATGLKAVIKRFQTPRMPKNEAARVSTLRSLNILDTLPEERFDRVTKMVRDTFGTPFVFANMVDGDRVWVKSAQCPGMCQKEMPRGESLCSHVILKNDVMVVPDLMQDDRFAENPAVLAMGMRFYVGCPLSVPSADGQDSVNIGTLCLADTKPRTFTEKDKELLRGFAREVEREFQSQRRRKKAASFPSQLLAKQRTAMMMKEDMDLSSTSPDLTETTSESEEMIMSA